MRILACAILALVCAISCGGSKDQDVLAGASSSGSSGTSSTSSGGSSSGSSGTTSSSGGVTDGGGTRDGGGGGTTCAAEKEPNDDFDRATDFTRSICGVLSPTAEDDYVSFQLPDGTKTMSLTFEGDVTLRVFVDGHDPVDLSANSNPQIPFEPGATYVILIRAAAARDTIEWKVNLIRS